MELSKEDKRIFVLEKEEPFKAVIKMGVPLVFGLLVMGLYNIVDTFFIGLLKDDYMLASVSLSYPIMMVSVSLSNMIGTGGASLISRSMGSSEKDKAEKTLTISMELIIILSLALTIFGLIFIDEIVNILGAKENTYIYTKEYSSVILLGSIFTMGSYTLGQLLRAEGSTKYSMLSMLSGTVINLVLDPIFIFALDMKVIGAAIATILGNLGGTLIAVYFYLKKKSLLNPKLKYIGFDSGILKEIFFVGIPSCLETLLTTTAYIVNNNLAVSYGELTVTAMGISQKVISIGGYIYQGFSAGNQPLMGYNYGAKNYSRMLKILKAGVITVTTMECFMLLIYGIFAPDLISIFSRTEEVILIGSRIMRANMFMLLFVGSISMVRSTFQAMGKPFYAFSITIVRQFVLYVPLLLVLNKVFGFYGMIWAQPITEFIMMIVSILLLTKNLKKLMND